ncbi:hypothetical protein TB2_035555 [Malus domestica]
MFELITHAFVCALNLNQHSGVPLKIKRLARDSERFIWAVSMAPTRCIGMQMRIGALIQDANMLIPHADCCLINLLHFADMLNHSFEPNCFFHWRFKDRMLEVMINAGKRIKKGDEMTVNYMSGQQNDMLMQRYGFSSPVNPWDVIPFSGNAPGRLSNDGDTSVDGAIIAAARTLPTWSEGDVPPIPSMERKAIKELQEECRQIIAAFPTNSKQDQKILDSMPDASRTLEAAIKYRLHRKLFIEKVMQALDLYQERILF